MDGLKDWDVEEGDGFGLWVWGVLEVKDVAIWAQAANDGGTGRGINGLALGADRDFAVVADADAGLLAPDKGPPGTGGGGTEDGAFFGERLRFGGVGSGAEFAVDFVLVGVRQELVEQAVGPVEFKNVVGGQKGREAFLPVVMAAFDFTFGLGCGRVAQLDAVKVEGLTELGESIGVVGVKERMEVDIQGQWQAVGLEDAGEKVVVGQQGFGGIEAGANIEAGGVIQDVEEGLFVRVARQPGMGAGIILPEGTQIAGLPAFDGLGCGFVAGVGRELVLDGPAAHAGAVGFKIQSPLKFAGASAVSGRWF